LLRPDLESADYIQITLGSEVEWRAGSIVNPRWLSSEPEELCDPSRINREVPSPADQIGGPVYRLTCRNTAVVHVRSFLDRWSQIERERRRFFRDWGDSSACAAGVFDYWALDVRDYTRDGGREVGFVPRPQREPRGQLLADQGCSIHFLMDQIEAIDREIGLPFSWFFFDGPWSLDRFGCWPGHCRRTARAARPFA